MSMIAPDLQHQIEQFLYYEARLLDQARYYEWLDLFAEDASYWSPVRETREKGGEPLAPGLLSIFEENKQFLQMRIKRLDTNLAHAEQPPSRTRHFVSNVEVIGGGEDELEVLSNVLVFQSRLEHSDSFFVGQRQDILRRCDLAWKIAKRTILLDQRLLPRAISILF